SRTSRWAGPSGTRGWRPRCAPTSCATRTTRPPGRTRTRSTRSSTMDARAGASWGPGAEGPIRAVLVLLGAGGGAAPARAGEPPEYQLKAAFLYNFALFTEWPADTVNTLRLCIHGRDPFGPELDDLQGRPVRERQIIVDRQA